MDNLIEGEKYKILYLCNEIHRCKLLKIHTPKNDYEILYTFLDDYGNKINFINRLIKSNKINFYHLMNNHCIIDIKEVDDLYY
jgi:hypothetical protein